MKRRPAEAENRDEHASDRPAPSACRGAKGVPGATDLPPALADPLDGFVGFLELERGLSRHTVSSYESDLRQCARFLARRGLRRWDEVETPYLSDWIYTLSEEKFAASSLARKLTALRTFARYLVREQVCVRDFTELLIGPKLVRRMPGTLTVGEVERLLAANFSSLKV